MTNSLDGTWGGRVYTTSSTTSTTTWPVNLSPSNFVTPFSYVVDYIPITVTGTGDQVWRTTYQSIWNGNMWERSRLAMADDIRQHEQNKVYWREQKRKLLEGEKRAEALLLSVLDEEQQASYQKNKYFYLVSQSGKRYRIRFGITHNVDLMEGGSRKLTFCALPDGVPVGDVLLTQLLCLRYNENHFLSVAHKSL